MLPVLDDGTEPPEHLAERGHPGRRLQGAETEPLHPLDARALGHARAGPSAPIHARGWDALSQRDNYTGFDGKRVMLLFAVLHMDWTRHEVLFFCKYRTVRSSRSRERHRQTLTPYATAKFDIEI